MKRSLPSLERRKPQRKPRKKFILFCEGENTEPAYFKMVQSLNQKVLVTSMGGQGVPMTIANKASELLRKLYASKDSFEHDDEVWAVVDRDTHPNFDAALGVCNNSGVKIAYSNPCFELWLILHHQDHDRPETSDAIQSSAERIVAGYCKRARKVPDCSVLSELIEQAENRANLQLSMREKEGSECGNPSTRVGELTKAIRTWDPERITQVITPRPRKPTKRHARN